LLLDYWPLGRFNLNGKLSLPLANQFLKEKWPFFLVGAASGVVTLLVQRSGGAMEAEQHFPWWIRLPNLPISYWRYLGRVFYPVNLSAYYPHPLFWPVGEITAAAGCLIAVSALVIFAARRYPFLATGWIWFVITLLPVIGLIQVGTQAIADRYTYIPSVGIFVMVCWGAPELLSRLSHGKSILASASAIVLLLCGWLTQKQIGYWKDSESLFRHALAVQPDNTLAHLNLGVALQSTGGLDAALAEYNAALRLNPNVAASYFSRGSVLSELGRFDEAIADFETGLRIAPEDAKAHLLLGSALERKGDLQGAISELQTSAKLNPDLVEVHNNLGLIFRRNGLLDAAIDEYRKAIAVRPGYADGHNNLAIALSMIGRSDEAISHFARAVQLNPNSSSFRANYAAALQENRRIDEAVSQYETALRLDPNNTRVRESLARLRGEKAQHTPTPLP
jgi:tetratricopeptide (TPR) repeat protein